MPNFMNRKYCNYSVTLQNRKNKKVHKEQSETIIIYLAEIFFLVETFSKYFKQRIYDNKCLIYT